MAEGCGASKDYDFPTKNHWRRWLWNRIAERCRNRRDALVVGMFGVDGLDFQAARARGFRPEGFISIERDRMAARAARENGITTIHGNARAIIRTAPRPIDVIVLDFCGGLSEDTVETFHNAHTVALCSVPSILAVNALRGRDAFLVRKLLIGAPSEPVKRSAVLEAIVEKALWENGAKRELAPLRPLVEAGSIEAYTEACAVRAFHDRLVEKIVVGRSEYHSNNLVFDSVVFDFSPLKTATASRADGFALLREAQERDPSAPRLRRKWAAALALRTMKLRGDLRGAA